MGERPKLLFHSNAPYAPTGYGQQTGLFAPQIAEHYDLAISAFYGLEGARLRWQDIPIFPGLGGEFGNEYLHRHAAEHFGGDPRGGLVLTLMDVWPLKHEVASGLNMVCWAPVDHDPAPPRVMQFFQNTGAIPLAISKFGAEQLAPFDPIYVPHGVDAEAFKPHDQAKMREMTGVPGDAFLVGMVAANKGRPSRKGFQQAFEAFRYLREKHDNAYLYLHTTMDPSYTAGEELGRLLTSLEIPPDAIMIADQYKLFFDPYSPETMGKIYSTFDVLLNPASGEGFGIPVLEAAACGVPSVVTDFTAMPEVVGPGWKIKGRPWWTGQDSWQAIPDVGKIVGALEQCYRLSAKDRRALSRKCRKHALNYAAPKVFEEHFLPALREVEERFGSLEPMELATA